MCVAVQEDKVLDLANDLGREGDRYDNRLVVLSLEVRLGAGRLVYLLDFLLLLEADGPGI